MLYNGPPTQDDVNTTLVEMVQFSTHNPLLNSILCIRILSLSMKS